MFQKVKNSLFYYLDFTEEELVPFLSMLVPRSIPKNGFFVREGEKSNHIAFVEKGLFKYYYLKEGKELINRFYMEDDWMGDYRSFLTRQPSLVYIEAVEDAQLFLLGYEHLQQLYNNSKSFERLGRLVAERLYLATVDRYSLFLSSTPEERYLKLLNERPQLVNRVPLKQIASFLGIQPESLSRIRKRINPGS